MDGKSLDMIVDTGAVATFVSADVMHIGNAGDLRSNHDSHVVSGRASARNVTIELGQSLFNQYVTVLSLKELSGRLGLRVDGILGADFLSNFQTITIDHKAHTVTLVH